MILLIDVGNQRLKWATSEQVASQKSRSANRETWADQTVELNHSSTADTLKKQFAKLVVPEKVVVSAVSSKSSINIISDVCDHIWGVAPEHLKSGETARDLINDYEDPKSLGVDRWCALVGARILQKSGDVVVVDAGTAVTVDFIKGQSNTFAGGLIIPGIRTMVRSLNISTGQIQVERFSLPTNSIPVFNINTESAVTNGAVLSVVAAVDRAIENFSNSKNSAPTIFSVGGDAGIIGKFSKYTLVHEPALVFLGMMAISSDADL